MKLNEAKQKHNEMLKKGQGHYKKMIALYRDMLVLQNAIARTEGDNYDPVPLIFGGGFNIDPAEDEVELCEKE